MGDRRAGSHVLAIQSTGTSRSTEMVRRRPGRAFYNPRSALLKHLLRHRHGVLVQKDGLAIVGGTTPAALWAD